MIGKTGVSVFRYTQEPSLQSRILWDVGMALHHNFFEILSNAFIEDCGLAKKENLVEKIATLQTLAETQQQTIASLQQEISIYKKVLKINEP